VFWFLLKKYNESESESTSTNGRHTDSVPLPTKNNRQEESTLYERPYHSPYELFKKARPSMTQDRFQFFTQLIAPFLHWHEQSKRGATAAASFSQWHAAKASREQCRFAALWARIGFWASTEYWATTIGSEISSRR
jgi:hypothetical protein